MTQPLDLEVSPAMLKRCLDALTAVRNLAIKWETQPTDYDEDTEQQIADGRELMAVLRMYGL